MNNISENIEQIASEIAENHGFFLVDFVLRGNKNNPVIEVFVDGEKNVSADDCASISREIDSRLDVLFADSSYRLDVSSPGVDRPLKFLKQFSKHINRKFEISYEQNGQNKKYTGRLERIEGEDLVFSSNNNETIIKYGSITKAKVIVSFS
jgi:ribosome maturation factor RimP